jgi:acyl carrier protein
MSSTTTDTHAAADAGPQAPPGAPATPMEMELARLIVSALSLDMAPEEIPPETPLFEGGLGLDSIDALELSLSVAKAYGVKLRSEDQRKYGVLASIRGLAAYIEKHRTT